MAYDQKLASRLETLVKRRKGFTQKQMFGGVGFLLNGNICFGVYKNYLILRLGPESATGALKKKYTKPFDITGRAMSGWVMVNPNGTKSSRSVKLWVVNAITFVKSLPPK
jgi:TfoX/Sxy family transcriptional regulator of competence genes